MEGVIIIGNRNRSHAVYFMVTERERDLIEQKMKLAGVRSIGAYLRKIAIDGYVIQVDLSDVRDMVSLLRTATNNMNQIARRANETRSVYEADIEDLRAHYDKLWDQANEILKGLAKI